MIQNPAFSESVIACTEPTCAQLQIVQAWS